MSRIHYFNENFFDVIDNEAKAYWLGFIVAEGNIYKSTLSIQLAAIDREHLLLLARDVQSDQYLDYRQSKNAYRLRLNSVVLVESLAKWNIIPCKSRFITVPIIPKELLNHFFRGFLDGDGWISRRIKNNTWCIGFASCCKNFLISMQNWINANIGKESGCIVEKKVKRCWQLCYSGNNLVSDVCRLLYENATIFLERKFTRWQRLLENRIQTVARNKMNVASKLLAYSLADGPKPVKFIMDIAEKNNISEIVFRRCRVKLGIKTKRIGFGAGSYCMWSLA